MPNEAPMNLTPQFYVKAGSVESSQDQGAATNVVLEDHIDMIGMMQFTLSRNAGFPEINMGDEAEARVGGDSRKMFKGYVTEVRFSIVNGVPALTVVAMDPLCKMASSRNTKIYEEMTDSDIASQVISNAGLTAGTVDSTSGTNKYVIQRNESDYFFLKRLAARNNYLLMANEGKVDFKKAQFTGTAVEVSAESVQMLDYGYSTLTLPKTLTVIGWDYATKKEVTGTATSVDPIGSGSDALTKADIWKGTSYVVDVLVASQSGAKAMAESELNRISRNFLRGRAVVQGNPKLFAGQLVNFKTRMEKMDAEAVIVSTRHVNDANGFLTEVHFTSNTFPK